MALQVSEDSRFAGFFVEVESSAHDETEKQPIIKLIFISNINQRYYCEVIIRIHDDVKIPATRIECLLMILNYNNIVLSQDISIIIIRGFHRVAVRR